MEFSKLAIIDSRIYEYYKIIDKLKEDVTYICIDYYVDTYSSLITKINDVNNKFAYVAFILYNSNYENSNFKLINNSESINQFINFIINIRAEQIDIYGLNNHDILFNSIRKDYNINMVYKTDNIYYINNNLLFNNSRSLNTIDISINQQTGEILWDSYLPSGDYQIDINAYNTYNKSTSSSFFLKMIDTNTNYINYFSINQQTGEISWSNDIVSGEYTIIVKGTNDYGRETTTNYFIKLLNDILSPSLLSYGYISNIRYGQTITINVQSINTGGNTDLIYSYVTNNNKIDICGNNGSITIQPLLDVSSYKITVSATSSSKPEFTTSTDLSFNIIKTDPSYNIIETKDIRYGQKLYLSDISGQFYNPYMSINNIINGKISFDNSLNIYNVSQNNYRWTFIPTDSNNYNDISGNKIVTILKTDPSSITVFSNKPTIKFGQTINDIELSGSFINSYSNTLINGSINFEIPTIRPTVSSNSYKWIFSPSDNNNYNEISANFIVSVIKSDPSIVSIFSNKPNIQYGQQIKDIELSGSFINSYSNVVINGNIQFETPDIRPLVSSNSYKWIFTVDNNYNEISSNFTVPVIQSDPSAVYITYKSIEYGQYLYEADLSGFYKNKYSLENITGSLSFIQANTQPTAGTRSYLYNFIHNNINYNTVQSSVNVTILQKTPDISGTVLANDVNDINNINPSILYKTGRIYNKYTDEDVSGNFNIVVNQLQETIRWTYIPLDTTNYKSDLSGITSFNITVIPISSLTYNNFQSNINYGTSLTITPSIIGTIDLNNTYTISVSPSTNQISINPVNGIITISNSLLPNTYNILVTATNSVSNKQYSNILTVQPVAPSSLVYPSYILTIIEGSSYVSQQPTINSGGIPVKYTISYNNQNITINDDTGVITLPNTIEIGTYNISVIASNTAGSITVNFTFIIIEQSNLTFQKASIYLPHLYDINDDNIIVDANSNNLADYYIQQDTSNIYISASLLANILKYDGDVTNIDNFTINELPQNSNTSVITSIKESINQIITNSNFKYSTGDSTYSASKYSYISDKLANHVLQYVLSVIFGIPNVQIPTVNNTAINNDISNFNVGNRVITDIDDMDTRKFILKQLVDNNPERFSNSTNQIQSFPLQKGDEFSFTIVTGFEIVNTTEANTVKDRLVYDMARLFNTTSELDVDSVTRSISITPKKWSIKLILGD